MGVVTSSMAEIVWCIEVNHDTTMWNEGFEHADEPWAVFYTNNEVLAHNLRVIISEQWNDGADMDKMFEVRKYKTEKPELSGTSASDGQLGFFSDQDMALSALSARLVMWEGI